MKHTHGPTATPPARTALRVTLAVLACTLALFPARAEEHPLVRAEALAREGRIDAAHDQVLQWMLTLPTDPGDLEVAARLSAAWRDEDLLERIQGRLEILRGERENPLDDLALGRVYLTLGRLRWERGVPSPTLAFLFADAEQLARGLVETQDGWVARDARLLLAETRYALGDVGGALDVLAQDEEPEALRLRGTWHYERAVSTGLDEAGRLKDSGRKDAEQAAALLDAALEEDLPREVVFDATMRSAWTHHRLGTLETARQRYLEAWPLDPTSPLPLRGLRSLLADRPDGLVEALLDLLAAEPKLAAAWDALALAQLDAGAADGAIQAVASRIALDERDPAGWILGGRVFLTLEQWREAEKHLVRALQLDPESAAATRLLQVTAQGIGRTDVDRSLAVWEEILHLRPTDPIVRNNYGFVLRELVSPHTRMADGGIQVLEEDAPDVARARLERCVAVYREGVALVPEDLGDRSENEVWILAGIVNDLGLMLHYFADVQDLPGAERMYLRALAMTDYGYKDTYSPNLQRLYAQALPGHELTWYRVAREARWAQMQEVPLEGGGFRLEPDEQKRALAAQDARRLRARLVAELHEGALEDGDPWPPDASDAGR